MPLIIDSRDARMHPKIKVEAMRALGHTNVLTDTLQFGDYIFDGHEVNSVIPKVGIELSTVSDLVGKIDSGRLNQQIVGLIKTYNVPVLMIQGTLKRNQDGTLAMFGSPRKIQYDRVKSVLWSLQAHGVKVEYTQDELDSAARIVSIYRYYEKDASEHQFLREVDTEAGVVLPLGTPIDRAIGIISSVVTGLGEKRARAAIAKWHSVGVVMMLREDQLREIPGWGPKIAHDFSEAVRKWHS